MLRLIICGSPRTGGRCAALANTLFEGCIAEFPKDEVKLVPISEVSIAGCVGCGGCNGGACNGGGCNGGAEDGSQGDGAQGSAVAGAQVAGVENGAGADFTNNAASAQGAGAKDAANARRTAAQPPEAPRPPRCVIEDDMSYIYENIEAADEIILVSPVYFSGAPSQLKALMDRLQPYYAQSAAAREAAAAKGKTFKTAKKPLTLHVVGEGKSPRGYDALVETASAAFAVAGFKLDLIADWVGKISPAGDITGDAQMYALSESTDKE